LLFNCLARRGFIGRPHLPFLSQTILNRLFGRVPLEHVQFCYLSAECHQNIFDIRNLNLSKNEIIVNVFYCSTSLYVLKCVLQTSIKRSLPCFEINSFAASFTMLLHPFGKLHPKASSICCIF